MGGIFLGLYDERICFDVLSLFFNAINLVALRFYVVFIGPACSTKIFFFNHFSVALSLLKFFMNFQSSLISCSNDFTFKDLFLKITKKSP